MSAVDVATRVSRTRCGLEGIHERVFVLPGLESSAEVARPGVGVGSDVDKDVGEKRALWLGQACNPHAN